MQRGKKKSNKTVKLLK